MPAGNVHVPSSAEGLENDPENAVLWAKVDEFKGKADDFYSLWQRLRAKRTAAARDPKALQEWNDLMGEAESVTAKVSQVETAINQAKSWAGGFFGVDNVHNGMGDLGLLPFVIAAVAGAIAWLGSWIAKGNALDRKLDSMDAMISQGFSPSQAAAALSDQEPGFLTALGSGLGKGLAFAAVGAVLLYYFFEKKRGF